MTTTAYDDAGRVTSVTDEDVAGTPSGNQDLETTYAHDADGNQTGVRAPTASRTTFGVTATTYDDLGRVTSTTVSCTTSGTTVPSTPACTGAGTADASHNITTTTTYDAAGNVVAVEAPDPAAGTGSTATVTTRYAYDGAGRLCRVLENASTDLQSLADPCATPVTGTADGDVSTRYEHDKAGNLVTATDAEGHSQSYAHDRLGRMTSRTDGLGATEAWAYDARGNRLSLDGRIAGTGDLVTWTYDAADRMLTRVADSATTTYGWDANGNMTSAAVTAETITTTWDRLDRPLVVTPGNGATTTYRYSSFTLLERDDPAGDLDFGLDRWGRQTTMKRSGSTIDTVSWRPDGLVASSANADGNTNTRTYDALGRVTEIKVTAGGTTKADMDYAYNRAGLARTEAVAGINATVNGTASFAYDHLGRLTGYDSPIAPTADRDYAWSKVANRTGVTSDPSGTPSTLTYTLDAADRVTADSASGTYGTDASGRVTARPSRQMAWDSLGRLTTVKDGSGTTITTYTYDALDRVRSYANAGTTMIFRYVGRTPSIALIRNDTAGVTDRLLLNDLANQPWGYLSAAGTGRVSWLLNAHHDTVATFDSSGNLGRYYRYTPDGAFAASGGTGATPTTRFQSSWYDLSTGLSWMVSRWYDPVTARFLSEDTLLGEPRNPDSRHRYAYGEGDPVNSWDPEGRRAVDRVLSKSFPGYADADGEFVLSIWIRSRTISSCVDPINMICAGGKGDGRRETSEPDCIRSRACISIRFGRQTTVTVRVNHSYGHTPFGSDHSASAFPIVWSMPDVWTAKNGIEVTGTQGMLKVAWNLKNSIAPAVPFSPAIDGSLRIAPPIGPNRRWQFVLENDAFPSLQLFYRRVPRKWQTVGRLDETVAGALARHGHGAVAHGSFRR